MPGRFRDRADAGQQLARALEVTGVAADAIVLGLPRGGVPVAAEIAEAHDLVLDVLCVRKLGAPMQRELAMGAIASGGAVVRNEDVIGSLFVGEAEFSRVLERERAELARREQAYRGEAEMPTVRDRPVLLVDDGLATGATMSAAVAAMRALGAAVVTVAAPVASSEAQDRLAREADRIVCLRVPMGFGSVGQWYEQFDQTTDEEVAQLLALAKRRRPP
jgi:putative phosphoribosyl transferase